MQYENISTMNVKGFQILSFGVNFPLSEKVTFKWTGSVQETKSLNSSIDEKKKSCNTKFPWKRNLDKSDNEEKLQNPIQERIKSLNAKFSPHTTLNRKISSFQLGKDPIKKPLMNDLKTVVKLDRNSVTKSFKCDRCKLFFEHEDHFKTHNLKGKYLYQIFTTSNQQVQNFMFFFQFY